MGKELQLLHTSVIFVGEEKSAALRSGGSYMSIRLSLIASLILAAGLSPLTPVTALPISNANSVLGTWKGESICFGNRPACKNEVVVYRIEAVPGKSGVVMLFADKIIDGERVPMGKLEFQYNEAKGELSCDFTINQTHGLWQFKVLGDKMTGTLVILPDKELGRNVKVARVKESEVPKAPNRELYDR